MAKTPPPAPSAEQTPVAPPVAPEAPVVPEAPVTSDAPIAPVVAEAPPPPPSSEAAPGPKKAASKFYRSKVDGTVYAALKHPVGYEDAHPEEYEPVEAPKKSKGHPEKDK
jgi:hypothetical protein